MTKELFLQAIIKFISGIILMGLLLLVPAGTIHYPNGWILMAILFIPMFIAGIIMMIYNPELLKKRLNAKEEQNDQKTVIALSGIMFLAAFITAGLNYRFNWMHFPKWVVYLGIVLFLASYAMFGEVLRENTYLSRTVEVQENQKVVDTGLYGIIRHPMYSATLILFLSMGLVLNSPISFLILLTYIPIIAKRIENEEEVLEKGLEGYKEYKQKVKYKVIPLIW
ncbi:MAG: isoprenylcysteine carboxylmethyltransferase family protein [Faecalicoccus sp.]|nr:isoprenylcysteine carboxylmethyltransferase family protein [Faecalicoccus sp.]